jgi:hypothetical protein
MNMTEAFAYLGCFALTALTVFQVSLIAGAPLGRFAWGGAHTVLPKKLRIASVLSVLLYALFATVILSKSGIWPLYPVGSVDSLMWVLTGYFMIGIVMNAISRSKSERMVMTPAAAILAFAFFMVARS